MEACSEQGDLNLISKNELAEYKTVTGYANLAHVEKDYLQHVLLSILSDAASENLVFKGGTCLQKCFGLPRFSEDLDFNVAKLRQKEALQTFESAAKKTATFGYEAILDASKAFGPSGGLNGKIRVNGPLFDGSALSIATISFDCRFEEPLLKAVPKTVTPPYEDLRPYSVKTMDLNEIFAEKTRAILVRAEPRDLYDVHFLIAKYRLRPDLELVGKKLESVGKSFSRKEFHASVLQLEKSFAREMPKLLKKELVPSFKEVENAIMQAFP